VPAFAAVDLGTNTCRMLGAVADEGSFRVVDSFSRPVRLGEGLEASGRLGAEAMERTLRALKVCANKLRGRPIAAVRGVATEACRRAANGPEFLARVAAETGLALVPISAAEEAQLTLEGCAALVGPGAPRVLMFDIGGGSTEVTWIDTTGTAGPHLIDTMSAPIGVVSFMERYGYDPLSTAAWQTLLDEVDAHLAPFEAEYGIAAALADGSARMLGTSGTVTTLGALFLGLERYDRSQVDGMEACFDDLSAVARRLVGMSFAERTAIPCIGRERAELVVVGCALLDAVHRRWPAATLRIADRGVREGLLARMVAGRDGSGEAA
jgi:exopolyphosphatase/guanosine-5'-triphosphate,3'-diphosphate pyrophosphatase